MTRIMHPTPTRGPAPSHSPPDMRYAPGLDLARALGWFSLGLGLAEVLAPRQMADLTGVPHPTLIQAFGLREIATGVGILTSDRPTGWMWGRVAGDVLDLGALADAAVRAGGRRQRVLASAAAVAGVTLLDAVCATQLSTAAALEG